MKVIPDSLLSCFERISSERYGLLYDLAAKGLFSLTELERIVEEFTIRRYNFAQNFHESAKAIPLKADIDARNVVSRNYYAMFHAARAVIFHFHRYDEEKHEEVIKIIGTILGDSFRNQLRKWKENRTAADYSPFTELNLMDCANKSTREAEEFLNECKFFLSKRGVSL
ncbi:HEPN domain-containing protein [Candidatus Poribacteria bacterium]|nr:HEPN domain-containing protein [Candidatus Poribacteria bacterium]